VSRRVVVVGGTGGFGRRLVDGIVATTDFDVVIASRDRARGAALAATLPSGRAEAIALDIRTVTPEALRVFDAFAVVDAAGPFQEADYTLPRAAIAAGLHYIDLADARDFVAGFPALDAAARAAGVVALTGASSTPALSHAVLDRLTAGWRRIDRIEIAISPGNRAAPRGLAVIRSILSYAGRPVRVFIDDGWATRPGWGMLQQRDIPGLGRHWLSLCETPDLDLVPARFAPRQTALFRAGLELSFMHLGLLLASLAVRVGLLRSLLPFTPVLRWIAERLARFGSDRGGMLVEATGLGGAGAAVTACWSLVAANGDGPFVPTLPALAALRMLAANDIAPGARACVGVLDLAAIEREFARHRITTETAVTNVPLGMPPFHQLLGRCLSDVPGPVRYVHSLSRAVVTTGRAEVERAANPVARLLCWFAGLPHSGKDVPVTVRFDPGSRGRESWRRDFAGRRYASTMLAGSGRAAGLLVEHFWPFTYCHRLTADTEGVEWRLIKWRLLGMPLPRWTLPTIRCFESADGERYRFDINVAFPLIGPVIRYRGWLLPRDHDEKIDIPA
jgi:uncharacterized protein DUF4166/saccharopine dehydrogenase-like protein